MRTWIRGMFGVVATAAALSCGAARAAEDTPLPPLVSEVTLDASPQQVWDVFATAEGWKLLGVAHAEVDFRVGGLVRTHYDPKGVLGDEKTIENTILAYEPLRMIAFRATKAPAGFPFPKEVMERTWSVATFEPAGAERTRLVLRGHGYGTDEASRKMRAFFDQGNAWTLERLRTHFAGLRGDTGDGSARPIEVTAVVRATPAEAFTAWTTSDGVQSFFGAEARVELRPLGPYEVLFDLSKPEGQRGSEGCQVLSWLPDRMVSFTWNAPPSFAHAREQHTHVVVEFEQEAPGWTRVRLTHLGWHEKVRDDAANAEEWRAARAYFAKVWPKVMEGLRTRFAAPATPPK